jgi:hypothetical protein
MEPGKGIHSYRVANVAIVDLALTLVAAYVAQRYYFTGTPLVIVTVWFLAAGVAAHRLFNIRTTWDKILF